MNVSRKDFLLLLSALGIGGCASRSTSGEAEPPESERRVTATTVDRIPPGPEPGTDISAAPVFTPFTVAPALVDRSAVARAVQEAYPPALRDAGISGRVHVHLFIDEDGVVQNTLLRQTSGYDALDRAGLQVGRMMRFTPARRYDEVVPVWISLPVVFEVR